MSGSPAGGPQSASARQWQPEVYLAFAAYRARPVEDLLPRITLAQPGPIYDLGCGPGNVTALLKRRWPEHAVTGVDSSPAMLAKARREAGADIHWREADIVAWQADAPAALIFANAALHWVPDHAALVPRLVGELVPGGQIAMQMPNTAAAPYKRCALDLAQAPAWRQRLAQVVTQPDPLNAGDYYAILAPCAVDIDIWETHYHHVLPDLDAVVDWVSGAALVPYLSVLDADEKRQFLAAYKEAAAALYPPQDDGAVLFTMRRLFFTARRPVGE